MTAAESPADAAPVSPPGRDREPRVWKFIGTSLWGLALFGAMFAGQLTVVLWFLVSSGEPIDTSVMTTLLSNGRIISLSVIMGLPAILIVLWIATRDYGAPDQITFLPAFWLLVPGASGLIGLTEAPDAGFADLATALTTVLSIALGVLLGTALYRWVAERGTAAQLRRTND